MRRSCLSRISNYNFGHPAMNIGYGQVMTRQAPPMPDEGVKTTVLENGTKVITHDKGEQAASVSIYADAGVKYDPLSAPGLSNVMSWSLLTSNLTTSMFQVNRALNAIGASWTETEIKKRHLGWTVESQREHWKIATEQLGTCLASPRFCSQDVEKGRDVLDAVNEETRWSQPRTYCVNELETVAFYKEPLGNPRMVPPETNDKCNTEALLAKYCTFMTPGRVTISAINVPHQELCAFYSGSLPVKHDASAPHFKQALLDSTSTNASEVQQYKGGNEGVLIENRPEAMTTKCDWQEEGIAAVGWLTNGGSDGTAKEAATGLVLQELFNIQIQDGIRIDRSDYHKGIRAFYRPYSTAGLIGFTVREEPKDLTAAVTTALKNSWPVDFPGTLAAAKARAVTNLFLQHESVRDYNSFLATSRHSFEELYAAIEDLKTADVTAAADFAKSQQPVFYSTGNIAALPSLRQILRA